MQSAIVVLVISFIWFYIGCFPFKYYIHESFHSHSCMNSFSLVHVYLYLDNRLSLDMIGMFHISYYGFIPMLWGLFHFVIIHRLFFLGGFMVMCSCSPFHFYHIELTHPRIYLRNENVNTFEKLLNFIGLLQPSNSMYHKGLEMSIHWNN